METAYTKSEEQENRFNYGKFGEIAFLRALKKQVIPNLGWGKGPEVTSKKWSDAWQAEVLANAVEGDAWFIGLDGIKYYVDVKSSTFIALNSLKRFRTENSYYFLNAGDRDGDQTCMIKADQNFKDYAMSLPPVFRGSNNTEGRDVFWNALPSDKFNSSSLKNIFELDSIKFRTEVRFLYEECRENNIRISL